ncbi:MAG: leucine--tRNA ligase [Chloroflexi bacterium]|nr:leucine--tRNA ligase [Chloroflexota bacterium]
MTSKYNPQEIEIKWQARWAEDHLYEVRDDDPRPKFYALTMFPYTSGDLHVGHWYALAPIDAYARYMRMKGYNVLHPIGFDAFGLPAENVAIKQGIHPFIWTMNNIDTMRRQLKKMGNVYDWSREIITCLPEYYKWTQWLFLQLYHAGLAYRALAPANWCPHCQTVLANEQVMSDGTCERCQTPVTRRLLEQWFLRIARYAEELLNFDSLDWPERVKIMQHNWIGRSEGVEIAFPLAGGEEPISIFTTRPDTIYGVTFLVLAPEHPLVSQVTTNSHRQAVNAYIEAAARQSDIQRLSTEREKTGVFTGSYVINPLNGKQVPIFVADYVLLSYGTGAVMGVPAHDSRDFDFAKKYDIPIPVVIAPPGWQGEELAAAHVESGIMVNSGQFNGLSSEEGLKAITDLMEVQGYGKRTVTYRLRDWLISRQRYWGAPIPIVYCPQCGTVPVPESQLPVLLPEDAEFRPTGESPLKYNAAFLNTICPRCHSPAQRETDTMDTFICSSWYFLRYVSPHYNAGPFDPEKLRLWLPVDLYTGGVEHATMHLLYARFFTKALRDLGLVNFDEPFLRLVNNGTILADHQKMSKSRGNVINPDEYVSRLGADAMRAYLMFMAPWEQGGDWSAQGINGIARWLKRVWDLVHSERERGHKSVPNDSTLMELRRLIHKTTKKVAKDLEAFHLNVMLASLMEYTNFLAKMEKSYAIPEPLWQEAVEKLLLLLAPTAPHLAEELWQRMGHPYSIHNHPFPSWNEAMVTEEEFTLIIQVNGKLRDKVVVPVTITKEEVQALVSGRPRIQPYLKNGRVDRLFYIPGRLVNIVN